MDHHDHGRRGQKWSIMGPSIGARFQLRDQVEIGYRGGQ